MRYVIENGQRYPRFRFKEAWQIQDETVERMKANQFNYVAACNLWLEIGSEIKVTVAGRAWIDLPQDRSDPRQCKKYFDFIWQLFDEDCLPCPLQHVFIATLKAGNTPWWPRHLANMREGGKNG